MLSTKVIKSVLETENFLITKETSKKFELKCTDISEYVYINKNAGNTASGLILGPNQQKKIADYLAIDGVVNTDGWYHSSNMGKFPKRSNNGKNPIPYGIPFGFKSEQSLKAFIKILVGNSEADDPIADIADAKNELALLSTTERDAIVKARVGQGPFRDKLISYWGACAVTGLSVVELLIASHSKPWKRSNNQERLDHYNGLLLSPNLDKAFDKGFISFSADKKILISPQLGKQQIESLGINQNMMLSKFEAQHMPYLKWHNENIFKK
jgi:putative restriction endonuclease